MKTRKKGLLITLEGPEGSGKTTMARAIRVSLIPRGLRCLLTHEPGDSALGKCLRRVLLWSENGNIDPVTELFLFEADRAHHVRTVIAPALDAGKIVLCARFSDSTTAYQGYGRGLDLDLIHHLNRTATDGRVPDMTILLDIAPESGLPRAFRARSKHDRIESDRMRFHRRVRKGFLELARQDAARFRIIDARRPSRDVRRQALEHVMDLLDKRGYLRKG